MKKPEDSTFYGMEPVPSGSMFDHAKGCQMSIDEKRQLVRETLQWSDDPVNALSSLTRKELLEIICAEMGKERKYSGFTKLQMIDHLLKLVSSNANLKTNSKQRVSSFTEIETKLKKQRMHEEPCQSSLQQHQAHSDTAREAYVILCKNLACKANLSKEDVFCKRCSCCICHHYDENKDPSLWLTCDSDFWNAQKPCGVSFHLKCALQHEDSGLLKDSCHGRLDGAFSCVSCGKIQELMRTWRKQLTVAREARRVDVLCERVSLSFRILEGTERYKQLQKFVASALKIIENEVGPLDQISAKMDRTIVNRLSWGAAVQELCASAVEAYDAMFINQHVDHVNLEKPLACQVHLEGSSPNGVTILLKYEDCLMKELAEIRIWHRKATIEDYPDEATCVAYGRKKRIKLTGLEPLTDYIFKISLLSKTTTLGFWEAKWSTPALTASSATVSGEEKGEKASTNLDNIFKRTESMSSSDSKAALSDQLPKLQILDDIENKSNLPRAWKQMPSACPNAPSTPCKSDGVKEMLSLGSKKQLEESEYEFSVKIIRRLEHEGHLESNFRVKFLTWFSLKATKEERRVVSVFINTFIDDPPGLAGQLMDTFMEKICREQKIASQHGVCTRFWH